MRLPRGKGITLAALTAILALVPSSGRAQKNSNAGSVTLNASLNSAITITAAPGLVNFALLRNGISNGSATVNITTSWVLPVFFGTVREYAYFSSPAAALTDGFGDNIPSANVSGSANGGAFTPFTGASPFAAGTSINIFNQFVIFFFNTTATRNDTLDLRINTTGLGLTPGTYTGVMHIQAQEL